MKGIIRIEKTVQLSIRNTLHMMLTLKNCGDIHEDLTLV